MVSKRKRLARKWRRTGVLTRALIFLVVLATFAALIYFQRPEDSAVFLQSNLVVFALINVNIIAICILAFLVGRNVVKLIFDRKKQILGSKLRLKLVTAFVGLALIPTVVIYFLASGLLNQAMEGWFSKQVEQSIVGSVTMAQKFYDAMGRTVRKVGAHTARELEKKQTVYSNKKLLSNYLNQTRKQFELFSMMIISAEGEELFKAEHSVAGLDDFSAPKPNTELLKKIIEKGSDVLREEQGATQFIRSYNPTKYNKSPAVLITTLRVAPNISEVFRQVNDSHREYEQMKLFKNPLKSGYVLTLALITGLILFAAVWIGFYIAKELTVPIQQLAEGTQAVARGNYDFQIKTRGDDEVASLVKSFNLMTSDLKHSRDEAENRRVLIEAILASLAVGVIALNRNGQISSVNATALDIFRLPTAEQVKGRRLTETLEAGLADQLLNLVSRVEQAEVLGDQEADIIEVELEVNITNQNRRINCSAGLVRTSDQQVLGSVLIFDDITELIQAQQMIAWREVARRIAHEIKNPLTPLQLCAQRLQKLVSGYQDNQAILDSTDTIIEHVASIKRLADEFSKFARMPNVNFSKTDIEHLVAGVLTGYLDSNPNIIFKSISEANIPAIYADTEQIRRCLINLIDNAIHAMQEEKLNSSGHSVTVRLAYVSSSSSVRLEVLDTGPGIPAGDKVRIFEPYFTTRSSGTGLGLAVVSSIVRDHRGTIRVQDNEPRGAKFVIDLPVDPRSSGAV